MGRKIVVCSIFSFYRKKKVQPFLYMVNMQHLHVCDIPIIDLVCILSNIKLSSKMPVFWKSCSAIYPKKHLSVEMLEIFQTQLATTALACIDDSGYPLI